MQTTGLKSHPCSQTAYTPLVKERGLANTLISLSVVEQSSHHFKLLGVASAATVASYIATVAAPPPEDSFRQVTSLEPEIFFSFSVSVGFQTPASEYVCFTNIFIRLW